MVGQNYDYRQDCTIDEKMDTVIHDSGREDTVE